MSEQTPVTQGLKISDTGVTIVNPAIAIDFNGAGETTTNPSPGKASVAISGGGSSFAGTQEKSTSAPNGVLTTFPFAHAPKIIMWNGAVQTLTDDYTVSSLNITFTTAAGVPQTGDKIVNIYA